MSHDESYEEGYETGYKVGYESGFMKALEEAFYIYASDDRIMAFIDSVIEMELSGGIDNVLCGHE